MTKKPTGFCLVFAAGLAAAGARSAAAEPRVVDRVAAVVSGEAITQSEVVRDAQLLRTHGAPASLDGAKLVRAALDERVERLILRNRLAAAGIKVTEEEVEGALSDVAKQSGVPREKLGLLLEREGATLDEYKDRLRDQIARSKVVGIEIRPHMVVDDDKAREYYTAHPEEFASPASVHLGDIFFPVAADAGASAQQEAETRARKAIERIRAGEKFEDVARELSTGPTAKSGGDLGTFKSGELRGELDGAVSKLAAGEISEPVPASGGIHVLKVIERVDAGTRPFDQVKDRIRDKISAPELANKYKEWLEKQKDVLYVEEMVKPEEIVRDAVAMGYALEATASGPSAEPSSTQGGGPETTIDPAQAAGEAAASPSPPPASPEAAPPQTQSPEGGPAKPEQETAPSREPESP